MEKNETLIVRQIPPDLKRKFKRRRGDHLKRDS